MSKRILVLFSVVALLIGALSGCAAAPAATPAAATQAPAPTAVPPTTAPEPTAVPPTAVPEPTAVPPTAVPEPTAVPPTEAPAQTSGVPADAALKVTGLVNTEIGWTEDAVRAMDTIEAQSTNKSGETSTYTGVPILKLLELAGGPKEGATKVVLVADDGFTSEISLAEVQACTDCIASFREKGGFSSVMPGFPGNAQVKGLVEIQLQ